VIRKILLVLILFRTNVFQSFNSWIETWKRLMLQQRSFLFKIILHIPPEFKFCLLNIDIYLLPSKWYIFDNYRRSTLSYLFLAEFSCFQSFHQKFAKYSKNWSAISIKFLLTISVMPLQLTFPLCHVLQKSYLFP
jgi:hypothetical protein